MNWILCKHHLPNEDEISYTTMIASLNERDSSDEVIALDKYGNMYVGCFLPSMEEHLYYGKCKTNQYTEKHHSNLGKAGWTFHSYHQNPKHIIAWMPRPFVPNVLIEA